MELKGLESYKKLDIKWLRRWSIIEYLMHEYRIDSVAEIGVMHADVAKRILREELFTGIKETSMYTPVKEPQLKRYLMVDMCIRKKAEELVDEYECAELIGLPSLEAVKLVEDKSFGLVFIDAHHSYESARDDIIAWLPKVKEKGFILVHDYQIGGGRPQGPKEACQELLGNFEYYRDSGGTAIAIKRV